MQSWRLYGVCFEHAIDMHTRHTLASEFFESLEKRYKVRVEKRWAGRTYVRLVPTRLRYDKKVFCRRTLTAKDWLLEPNLSTQQGRELAEAINTNSADLLDWGDIADLFSFRLDIRETDAWPVLVVHKDDKGTPRSAYIDLPDSFVRPVSFVMAKEPGQTPGQLADWAR